MVEVFVGALEFGFEFDVELVEVEQFPCEEFPCAVGAVVGEAEEEVAGGVLDFTGEGVGFVVEGAEGAGAGGGFEEFGVEVGDATGGGVGDLEVRVAGALGFAVGA